MPVVHIPTVRNTAYIMIIRKNGEHNLQSAKILMLGKIEGRRRGQKRMRQLDGITDSTDMSLSKLQEMVKDREGWHSAVHGVSKSWTGLSDWTKTTNKNNHKV